MDKYLATRVNSSKCKALSITNKRNKIVYAYSLAETQLEWVNSYRYLGVIINNNLKWGDQSRSVAVKANRVLNLLRRSMYGCTKEAKNKVYKALVRPHLEYCCPVWSPHSKTDRATIEKVQRKAARWINARWDKTEKRWSKSYVESLNDLRWPTIEQRHFYLFNCQIYKIVNRLDCINFSDNLTFCNASQARSYNINSLQCMPSRVNCYRYSFFY